MLTSFDAVEMVARLMMISARTAPKARGSDALVVSIVTGDKLNVLAEEMRSYGENHNIDFFIRDAGNVENSSACVLIGAKRDSTVALNCGGCGYGTCGEMLEAQESFKPEDKPFRGPNCAIRMADLGIALGSAVKTAAMHNVDNRIMYSAGVGAILLGWMDECNTAYGIPLRVSSKNIYFDRPGN
jgi:uncharacterized ferredoxin-like protein